jgi:hypothetical protein
METTSIPHPDLTAERLAGELADVQASISLVNSGVAASITLTGLRFGRQLAESLREAAAGQGVLLEATFWTDDDRGDIHVSRPAGATDPR